jgi:uncharacterized protein
MRPPVVLVMAKAPVEGRVKTRLAASVGDEHAARLACAALLDTLDVCEEAFGAGACHLAMAGDLEEVHPREARQLDGRLDGWTVLAQRGSGFGERLENAHRDVHAMAGAAVVQIGSDTPQVEATVLGQVASRAAPGAPVLGLAHDGGWWVLASATASDVAGLRRVPMSAPDTGRATLGLLTSGGAAVVLAPTMRDVDDATDAALVAAHAPQTRFARTWRTLTGQTGGQSA